MDKKDEILTAATELFKKYGFEKVTLTDIAGDCGLKKSGLYYYFKNKEEIVEKMIVKEINTIKTTLTEKLAISSNDYECLFAYIIKRVQIMIELKHYFDMFANCVAPAQLKKFVNRQATEYHLYELDILSAFIKDKLNCDDDKTRTMVTIILGISEKLGHDYMLNLRDIDLETEVKAILTHILIKEK